MNNEFKLPSNYGTGREEECELVLVRQIFPQYLALQLSGRTNSGTKTAVLCSNTDGSGTYSSVDHAMTLRAGIFYRGLFGDSYLFNDATSRDIEMVVQNTSYKNIVVIGHSSYHSWQASDKSVDWHDLGQMTSDHLKNGLFINIGCGQLTSWNKIPLGLFVVNNSDNLFGKYADYMHSDHMTNVSRLEQLRNPLKHIIEAL